MTETPVSLLDRLRLRPDEPHWERFVRLFTPLLRRWAGSLGVPAADVEDVLQDAFLILIHELPGFRYDPSKSFRAWLWTAFRHEVLRWRKRQTRPLPITVEHLESLGSPDTVAEATETEYRRVVTNRMLQLVKADYPPQTWQIFRAIAIEGRSGMEIAGHFKVSPNAVYLIRSRVLARLRQEFAELER